MASITSLNLSAVNSGERTAEIKDTFNGQILWLETLHRPCCAYYIYANYLGASFDKSSTAGVLCTN